MRFTDKLSVVQNKMMCLCRSNLKIILCFYPLVNRPYPNKAKTYRHLGYLVAFRTASILLHVEDFTGRRVCFIQAAKKRKRARLRLRPH